MKLTFDTFSYDGRRFFFDQGAEFHGGYVSHGHYACCEEQAELLGLKPVPYVEDYDKRYQYTMVITTKRPHHRKSIPVVLGEHVVKVRGQYVNLGGSQHSIRAVLCYKGVKKVWVYFIQKTR